MNAGRAGRWGAVLAVLWGWASGQAQEPRPVSSRVEGVDSAIARAVGFLVGVQDREGAIADRGHNQTAMTALGLMALAAVGHQPADETREGTAMRRALEFVLRPDRLDPQGYFGSRDGSRMYGHGIVTLMLSEMLGMGVDAQQDQLLRERVRRAVDLILRAQAIRKDARNAGGWRYNPDSPDSDLSVTVWQVMALRSARNAGLEVPKEAIDQAVGYLERCYYSKRDAQGRPLNPKSAFAYEPNRAPEYAMASAGLLAMQVCGKYDAPEVAGAADWLKERPLEVGGEWFFYGTYYYAQGMYQRGGEYAAHARKAVEEALLPIQDPDGAWRGRHGQERDAGRVYATSLAVLSLAVKHHYLPIYQR
ncbi:MAG: prenyltransferase/squalene oxidase repeat-containing protein [Planctomycetota bacterium]